MNKRFETVEGPMSLEARMQDDIAREELAKEHSLRVARREQRWQSSKFNRALVRVGVIGSLGLVACGLAAGHFASENEAKTLNAKDRVQAGLVAVPQADKEAYLRTLCDADSSVTISGVPVCDTFTPQTGPDFDPSHLPQESQFQNP